MAASISHLDLNGMDPASVDAWMRLNAAGSQSSISSVLDDIGRHVSARPNASAVSVGHDEISYADLAEAVIRMSKGLHIVGVEKGSRIGVVDTRTIGVYIAILAALYHGCSFVPINPCDPPIRTRHILNDARLSIVVIDDNEEWGYEDGDDAAGVMVTRVGDLTVDTPLPADTWRPYTGDIDELAYIMYSSGSAGVPRGVKVSHRSLQNLIDSVVRFTEVDKCARVGQISTLYFDPCIQQIFPAWSVGACVYPAPLDKLLDPHGLAKWLHESEIEHIDMVTPHWIALISAFEQSERSLDLPHLRWALVGGETMTYHQVERWKALCQSAQLVNVYGPTEATVNATWYKIAADGGGSRGPVPIGHPLPGYNVFVITDQGRVAQLGEVGEIIILGAGVADGYTSVAGRESGFGVTVDPMGDLKKSYTTGDLGKLSIDPDGSVVLQFCGRVDSQVKVHGYRVEIEEVQTLINQLDYVGSSVVFVIGEDADRRLVCLYSAASDVSDSVRTSLRAVLPSWSVPSEFVRIDNVPIKITGKLDPEAIRALYIASTREPIEQATHASSSDRCNAEDTEGLVAAEWLLSLRHERDGGQSYSDSGGTSLRALRLASVLRRSLDVPVRATDVLSSANLSSFQELVSAMRAGTSELNESDEAASGLHRPDCRELPVTDRERALEFIAGGGLSNLISFDISGYSRTHVTAAITSVLASSPTLRSRVCRTGNSIPVFMTHAAESVCIEGWSRRSVADDPYGGAHLTSGGQTCRFWIEAIGERTVLHASISHCAADGESLSLFERRVSDCLSSDDPSSVLFDGGDTEYLDYVQYLSSRTHHTGRRKAHQWDLVSETAQAVATKFEASENRSVLTYEVRVEFVEKPDLIVAHLVDALFAMLGRAHIGVTMDYHGRLTDSSWSLVGDFAGAVPVVFEDRGRSLTDLCEQFDSQTSEFPDRYVSGRSLTSSERSGVAISLFEELSGSRFATPRDPVEDMLSISVRWLNKSTVVDLSGIYDSDEYVSELRASGLIR